MTDETRRQPTALHRRDRNPRPAWLTPHADRRLRTELAQLPELLALVATHPLPLRHGSPGPRPAPTSRPPLSLAALTLADRRTRVDDVDIIGLADLERTAGRRDGIEPTIRAWVLLAEGEMLDDGAQPTPIPETQQLAGDCAWLAHHIVWITEQQWVIELAGVVHRAVRDCEQHLHIRPTYQPLCPGCHGLLVEEHGYWQCPDCGATHRDDRMSLRQAVAKQQPMTVGELVRAFGWSAKTIESWIHRGHLTPVNEDTRPRRYHVLDALRLADSGGASMVT